MWQGKAKTLFLFDGKTAAEISKIVCKRRETVHRYLSGLPEYGAEMAKRREEARARRGKYKQDWEKLHRGGITKEDLQNDHRRAVIELSREKYY